ncbi:MAG: YqzG/YhdC family protein [Bacillota bacterium]
MVLKMKRHIPIVLCLLFIANTAIVDLKPVHAQQEIPSYAKWGSLAVKKTKEKYPDAAIVDYLHIGKENGSKVSTEKFKLWLKRGGKEFGVFVDIQFETDTEKMIDIKFTETDR